MIKCAEPRDICTFAKPGGHEPIGVVARGYLEELGPTKVAAELGLDSETLEDAIASKELLDVGLGPLEVGGNITRESWVLAFHQTAQQLGLGDPVVLPPGPLAPGSTARIVSSPGIDQVSIPPSCDSNNYVLVRVGQTVRVTRQCPHVDRFCIRADDGNVEDGSVLGCALRAQLEPNGRANE